MLDDIWFFFYRLQVSYYLIKEMKMTPIEAFKFSDSFFEFWLDGIDPDEAVDIELSYWDLDE